MLPIKRRGRVKRNKGIGFKLFWNVYKKIELKIAQDSIIINK